LGDGSGLGGTVDGEGSLDIDGRRVNELAARSINAVVRIVLEGHDDSNVHEEGDDDRDGDQSAESNGNNAGQGHSDGEDELVADAVKEKGEKEGQEDESGDQGHQDESLRGLGDVAEVTGAIVVEDGGGTSSDRGGGLHSVQVVVDLGLVDGGGGGSQRSSSAGARDSLLLEIKGLLESVPGSDGSGDHETDDGTSENDGAAVARSEGGGH